MRRNPRTLVVVLGTMMFAACTSWHRNASPSDAVARAKSGEIRVNRVDGSMISLVNASIVGDSLVGVSPVTGARVSMPVSAVVSTETEQVSAGRTALLGGGVVLGLAAVASLLLVALLFSLGN